MSRVPRRAAALFLAWAAAGCGDRPTPAEPGPGSPPTIVTQPDGAPTLSRQQERHQRLARWLAMALRDEAFRSEIHAAFRQSRLREGKLHLQGLLARDGARLRHRLAAAAGALEFGLAADLDGSRPVEIYLPVPRHRREWQGGPGFLVATAERDGEAPVAFDARGERRLLDPDLPPAVPVIALGTAETAFPGESAGLTGCVTCDEDPDGGTVSGGSGGGGSGGGTNPTAGSGGNLYLSYASFDGTFEGWLKGEPEFEVHLLGQDGSSTTLRSYQCAGAEAGAPYAFDQNEATWTGSVMLFSEAQFASYEAAHPGQSLRVLVLEDDDTPCGIRTDSTRIDKTLKQLTAAYGTLTGGKKESILSIKTFSKAVALYNLGRSVWSFITTQDDLVGYAVEDSVVSEYWGGANWIVKGENTITHGALRLEMR